MINEQTGGAGQEFFHILLYGEPGAGKSHCASHSWYPQLVALFDSLGNARPYLENMQVQLSKTGVFVNGQVSVIPTYDCYALEDAERKHLVRRIWHFASTNPNLPLGYRQFEAKLAEIPSACTEIGAKFFVLDSLLTYTVACKRQVQTLIPSAGAMDEMELARGMTPMIEDMCYTLNGLQLNVILCAHVSNQQRNVFEQGKMRKMTDNVVTAPGKMARNILGFFSDVWYCYRSEAGEPMVQLINKDGHIAKNTVSAIEDCSNSFDEIIKNRKPIQWVGAYAP